MDWHFIKYRPDETTRDPIVGEFFSTEAIENPAQALVREGIQNALDALNSANEKIVRVRIYCGKLNTKSTICQRTIRSFGQRSYKEIKIEINL